MSGGTPLRRVLAIMMYNVGMEMSGAVERQQRRAALLVAGCTFMELLDATIVTTSAPRIGHALDVPVSSVSLVITAYLVTVASLIPVSGWMAARFGARRLLLLAIGGFALASLGCALSDSLQEQIAFRVLQGAAGAMMVPVGRAMVFSAASKDRLMQVTALLVWPALVAPVIAPLAGGLITTYASWHWLFLINLPLGALALIATFRIIRPPAEARPGPLDGVGVIVTCFGITSLTVTCSLLSRSCLGLLCRCRNHDRSADHGRVASSAAYGSSVDRPADAKDSHAAILNSWNGRFLCGKCGWPVSGASVASTIRSVASTPSTPAAAASSANRCSPKRRIGLR